MKANERSERRTIRSWLQSALVCAAMILTLAGCAPANGSASDNSASNARTFRGMCDASAVVALNDDLFVVGDDEDSVLRVFSLSHAGAAVQRFNTTAFLGFQSDDEADIEGSARIGDRVYWITSHGNNRKGKEQESRQRFFAITVETNGGDIKIQPSGRPYTRLLDDLLADPRLRLFNLAASANLPPKAPGALNIEGLASTPDGHLLIGFRNPVPRGKALIAPLLNPAELLEGKRPHFGDPVLLDLRGQGVRSIERWQDKYLIVAGSVDGKGKSRLFEWHSGSDAAQLLPNVNFGGINPEAISIIERGDAAELLVVSDDGTRKVNGVQCKKLLDPMQKTFRAMTIPLTPQLAAKSSN